ncbi:MAG TPA: cupin domain-containing protein [Candidatus Elarobacter sp.]|jgi:quercetin dioxygenase-like cupin family protein|nr:cupin domain-containing protein [Candidatus Elarobacter sp.]
MLRFVRIGSFVFIAALLAAAPLAAQTPSPAPGPPKAALQIINRADVAGIPGKEGVMLRAEWPVSASTGRHTHHGDEYAYVVDGTLEVHADGQPTRTMHAGDSWHMPEGTVHETINPGPAVAHSYSFFVVDKGKPLSEPAH